jgi:hypothetical protein
VQLESTVHLSIPCRSVERCITSSSGQRRPAARLRTQREPCSNRPAAGSATAPSTPLPSSSRTSPFPHPLSPRRELLESGFVVRAGARDVEAAEAALRVAVTYGIIKPEQLKRVTIVPFDLAKPDGFEEAIGSASKASSEGCI